MGEKFSFREGACLNKPPLFCGMNYELWCIRIKFFVESIDRCSVRLTWDVFVRDLNRQLGIPSHWLPVDSCKEGEKGTLAAVCTPTLKSTSKKHQKLCTSISEHRV